MTAYSTGCIQVMDTPVSAAAVLPCLCPSHLSAEHDLHHFRHNQIKPQPTEVHAQAAQKHVGRLEHNYFIHFYFTIDWIPDSEGCDAVWEPRL